MYALVFDVESNGLHGQAFAVGAVLYDIATGRQYGSTHFRCPIEGDVDPWVGENVLPNLWQPENFANGVEMRTAFWNFLQQVKSNCQDTYGVELIVMADVAYPVETRFLAACQDDDPDRAWNGPYPLHDLATWLLAAGYDTDVDRFEMASMKDFDKHDPMADALASAKCATILYRELRERA